MAYGSILGKSSTTWTNEQILSDATAALFGLGTDAVPDDAFNAIASGSAGGVVTGTVIWFAKSTAPAGYLVCDGSTFSAETYPALYAVLETTTLPNLINKFIKGSNTTLVNNSGSYITEGRTGEIGTSGYSAFVANLSNPLTTTRSDIRDYVSNGVRSALVSNSILSYIQPPNISMLPCIKY